MRTKLTCLCEHALLSKKMSKSINQRASYVWQGGVRERRAAAFACIGIQSKLGYNDGLPALVADRTIHFSLVILKDAQIGRFLGQRAGNLFAIAMAYAQKNYQARTDLGNSAPTHGYFSTPDSL